MGGRFFRFKMHTADGEGPGTGALRGGVANLTKNHWVGHRGEQTRRSSRGSARARAREGIPGVGVYCYRVLTMGGCKKQ